MKTRIYLPLIVILMLPSFTSTTLLGVIAVEWIMTTNHTSYFANLFLTGEFNKVYTLCLFGLSSISTGTTIYFALWVKQHASAIDKLEKIRLMDKREDLLYLEQIKKYVNGS